VDQLLAKREVCEDIGKQFEPEKVKKLIKVASNNSPDSNNKQISELKDELACDEVID
jgi:flagellar motility protein MotE (MotC chaperone)